jgi:hypothetical protein
MHQDQTGHDPASGLNAQLQPATKEDGCSASHTTPSLQNTPTLHLKYVLHLDQVRFSMPDNQMLDNISHTHLTLPEMDACLAPFDLRHPADVLCRHCNDLLQLIE